MRRGWQKAVATLLFLACSGCIPAIQLPSDDKQNARIFRIADQQISKLLQENASPDEKFAMEWYSGGEYVFAMLNRGQVNTLLVTEQGLALLGADNQELSGYTVDILRNFHKTTLEALDPSRTSLSGRYWYTEQRLAQTPWEGEALLKLQRDRFYEGLRQALVKARPPSVAVARVKLTLPTTAGQEKTVACVVVHDETLHEPANYMAEVSGVDVAHIRPDIGDRLSVRILDLKIQEYFCKAESLPRVRGQEFNGSKALYQSAISRYLDSRQDLEGKLQGMNLIKQYLAATIVGAFQRGPQEAIPPVGLFVELKVREMEKVDGGKKYVMHRFVDDATSRETVKALREAVALLNERSQGRPGDVLSFKIQTARELSENPRQSVPVRRVLKHFVEAAELLMPEYSLSARANLASVQDSP